MVASDRRREVRIADSTVMGRLPILVTSTLLALAALTQIAGNSASKVVGTYASGSCFDLAWSAALIIACVLVWIGRVRGNRYDAAGFEIGGIAMLDLGLATYLIALYASNQFAGSWIIVALCVASICNCTGRAILLRRRMKELRRVLL